MNAFLNERLVSNIEQLAENVAATHGHEVVVFIFSKYGAHCLDDMDPAKYSEVYSEFQYYSTECWEGEEI